MRLRSVLVFVSAAALLLLPASTFAFLSALFLPAVPNTGVPRHYARLTRAVTALLIVGAVFLSSWTVHILSDDGRPMLQALPWLASACVEVREALSFLFSVSLSPACRLIVLGPMQEFGSGFFVELFLFVNLVWIKVCNYQDLSSTSSSEAGWSDAVLFIFQALLMGWMGLYADMVMSAKPIEPPDALMLSIFFALGVAIMYAWVTAQGMLFTARGPRRRVRRGLS